MLSITLKIILPIALGLRRNQKKQEKSRLSSELLQEAQEASLYFKRSWTRQRHEVVGRWTQPGAADSSAEESMWGAGGVWFPRV